MAETREATRLPDPYLLDVVPLIQSRFAGFQDLETANSLTAEGGLTVQRLEVQEQTFPIYIVFSKQPIPVSSPQRSSQQETSELQIATLDPETGYQRTLSIPPRAGTKTRILNGCLPFGIGPSIFDRHEKPDKPFGGVAIKAVMLQTDGEGNRTYVDPPPETAEAGIDFLIMFADFNGLDEKDVSFAGIACCS